VSEGCRNCYAERVAFRFSGPGLPYEGLVTDDGKWSGEVRFIEDALDQPLRWARPRRIFVNSMSDLFHEALDFEVAEAIFGVMAAAPRHTFQILTKRPKRMLEFFQYLRKESCAWARGVDDIPAMTAHRAWKLGGDRNDKLDPFIAAARPWPLPNVWLGVSIENQRTADERIPLLLKAPAALRWVSAEPLVGPVDLRYSSFNGADSLQSLAGINWVVTGGESGSEARPAHPGWFRALRDQCAEARVPFFFKQWGEWAGEYRSGDFPLYSFLDCHVSRIGKQAAGKLLDGREHLEFPTR
jgi:protein gp37